MILSSPELENTLVTAEYALKGAEADYQNLKVTLQKQLFDMQATAAQFEADYNTAKLQADRDAALAKEQLLPEVDAEISKVKAQQLYDRVQIEKKRMATYADQEKAQLDAQNVKVEQLRADYKLKQEPGGPVEGARRVRRHAASAAAATGRRWKKGRKSPPARRSARSRSRRI